jgi:hypothetical protein
MGLQRGLHRRHDPGARCRVGVLEQPLAEPARLEEVDGVGHVSTQPQRLGDRLDGDVDEPGSVQDGHQVLPVAQRERSGTARVVGRRRR